MYATHKGQFATDKTLKKPNFKDAIEQIEAAQNGEDSAPTEVRTLCDQTEILNSRLFRAQIPAVVDTTLDTTVDTTFDRTVDTTLDRTVDESKLDETADADNNTDDGHDANESDEEATNPSVLEAPKSEDASESAENDDDRQQGSDKNISRSGRVIKRTKYLHDEFEESPVLTKKKRPSENPAIRPRRDDEHDCKRFF